MNPEASPAPDILAKEDLEKELINWVKWISDSSPGLFPISEDIDKLNDFKTYVKKCVTGEMSFEDLCYELYNYDVVCVDISQDWYPLPFQYIKSLVINPLATVSQ